MKETLEGLKDLNQVKAIVERARAKRPKTARDAYRAVFGGVWYTEAEMKAWKAEAQKQNLKFNEADYKKWQTQDPKPKPVPI